MLKQNAYIVTNDLHILILWYNLSCAIFYIYGYILQSLR